MQSKSQIQFTEQRSIALFNENEGPQSLPVYVDRKCFQKTDAEKGNLRIAKSLFRQRNRFN